MVCVKGLDKIIQWGAEWRMMVGKAQREHWGYLHSRGKRWWVWNLRLEW
jgi:hypothetical protein